MGSPEGTMGRPRGYRESLFQLNLAQAAIAHYWRLGGLNNTHLFLTVLEANSLRSGVRTWCGSGEDPPLGCRLPTSLVSLYSGKRGSQLSGVSFIRALVSFRRGLLSCPYYYPKAPLPRNYHIMGLGLQHMAVRGDINIQSIAIHNVNHVAHF